MDDFSEIIRLLETARQLAELNKMDFLAYLIGVAQSETRENRQPLRNRRRGQVKDPSKA